MRNSKTANTFLQFAGWVALASSFNAHAIDIWHSDTVWVNQGMCAATFTLDGGGSDGSGQGIGSLEIAVDVLGKSGKLLQKDTLEIEPFSDSDATRYQTAHLVGENYCEDNLTINITRITETVNGKKRVLPLSEWSSRDFKPFNIKIAGKSPTKP